MKKPDLLKNESLLKNDLLTKNLRQAMILQTLKSSIFMNTFKKVLCSFLAVFLVFSIFFLPSNKSYAASKKSLTVYPILQITNLDYFKMSIDQTKLQLLTQFVENTPNLTLVLDPTISLYKNSPFYSSLLNKDYILSQKGNTDFITNSFVRAPKKVNYKMSKDSIYIMPYNQLCDSTFSILQTNKVKFVLYPSSLDNTKVEMDSIQYQAYNLELNTLVNKTDPQKLVSGLEKYQYNSSSSSILLINNLYDNLEKLPYLSSLVQSKYLITKKFVRTKDGVWDDLDVMSEIKHSFTEEENDSLVENAKVIRNYELAIKEKRNDIKQLSLSFNSYDLVQNSKWIDNKVNSIKNSFTSSIKLELPENLNLISQDVPLPISIKNDLAKNINVRVELVPKQNGILVRKTSTMEISKKSQQQVQIPITSLFSGTNHIKVNVFDETGRYLITEGLVTTNSIIEIGTFVFVLFIVVSILLLIGGIIRTIKHNYGKDSREHKFVEVINKD